MRYVVVVVVVVTASAATIGVISWGNRVTLGKKALLFLDEADFLEVQLLE